MPEENYRITQEVELVPKLDKAAASKAADELSKQMSKASAVRSSATLRSVSQSDLTASARRKIPKGIKTLGEAISPKPIKTAKSAQAYLTALLNQQTDRQRLLLAKPPRGKVSEAVAEEIRDAKTLNEEIVRMKRLVDKLSAQEGRGLEERKTKRATTRELAKRETSKINSNQALADITVATDAAKKRNTTEALLERKKLLHEQTKELKAQDAAERKAEQRRIKMLGKLRGNKALQGSNFRQSPRLSSYSFNTGANDFEKTRKALGSVQKVFASLGKTNAALSIRSVRHELQTASDSAIYQKFATIKESISQVGTASNKMATAVASGFKKLGNWVGKATRVFTRFGKVMVWRAYRMAAMAAIRQMIQGFKNLNSYSETFGTQFHENVQRLKTSVTFLGNAFAAMVAPIINAVTPALEKLMDTIANLANRIGQFIASALGQEQFSAALKHTVSDAKSAGGKMKDILGFDEINRLSGDTGAGDDASRMFTEWGTLESASGALGASIEKIKAAWETMKAAVAPIFTAIGQLVQTLLPVLLELIAQIMTALAPIVQIVAGLITNVVNELGPFIEAFMPVITNTLETITPFITRIVDVIANLATELLPVLTSVMTVVSKVIEAILAVATPILDIIVSVIEVLGSILVPIIGVVGAAVDLVAEALSPVVSVIKDLISLISAILTPVLGVLKGAIEFVAKGFGTTLVFAIGVVKGVIAGLAPTIEKIGIVFKIFGSSVMWIWNEVKGVIESVVNFASTAWETIKKLTTKGGEMFEGIKEGISSVFKQTVNIVISGINKVIATPINALNLALRKIRDVNILGFEPFKNLISTIAVPQIPLLASGGVVPNKGNLFVANEAGPEVVANMGHSTGVMNTNQMQAAMAAANAGIIDMLYSMGQEVIRTINNKDTDVYLDGRKVGESVSRYQNSYSRSFGV